MTNVATRTPRPTPIRLLHLLGVDDTKRVQITRLSPDPARLGLHATGNVEIRSLLGQDFDVTTLLCGDIPGDPLRAAPFDVVLNAICDCDTNVDALIAARRIAGELGIPVFNHPDLVSVTSRDQVSDALAGIDGLHVPATVRVAPGVVRDVPALVTEAGLSPPYLFRKAGTHGGVDLVLVEDHGDLDELERFAFDGSDFYATEFVDYRSADGLYRKYRVIVVGGRPIPKHLIACRGWNVHARDRVSPEEHPELQAEDDDFVGGLSPALAALFERIHERLGLDYFGADFGIADDGTVVLFEANSCVRALVGSSTESEIPSHRASTELIRSTLRDRLVELAGPG